MRRLRQWFNEVTVVVAYVYTTLVTVVVVVEVVAVEYLE